MKFSIAVLSSIIAVCSVTIANPVDPSSTMSSATSTPTASTSATSTGGPTSSVFSSNNAGCDSFDQEGIDLIKAYANIKMVLDNEHKKYSQKESDIEEYTKLINKKMKKLELLEQKAQESNGAVDYTAKISQVKYQIRAYRAILKAIKDELMKLYHEYLEWNKGWRKLRMAVYDYLEKHDSTGEMAGDTPLLKSIPEFMQCFVKFYSGSPDLFQQSEHGAVAQDSGAEQQTLQP
ncbi:hypothetical protein BATDEDRAFT_24242 [Batrachochytrium dendrobatidis JAM81]|uniref:Uncharacterized protein n=2 Tax=Batrachochytrium dendrobatidis TaxID=109871 RepID=F4P0V8_BATDJ|nr:uncharacterized protein BATDEDRAFT_24242 [Batrachochytrium dendrobatidis JAM81]EGF81351.1 hypothetical protein BATDEDRAFT_24242 [Batrachochytrium dendrobatidis JAM81]KAK5669089.1 hypothetical protein QVD99_004851 [Batrachochytrium dendrobatidis]|eukprot:XP_006677948.1 hypothetical protein BATDEDRAFT_24242 [Batrachochytrium dendrobatidis JAM81]